VLNLVLASGEVKSPALRYDANSKPEFRFTLQQMEKDWPLYLPCFSPGAAGERLASELEAGQHILITSGKLAYKKRATKAGEVSRLEILVWAGDRLSESTGPAQADAPESGSGLDEVEINHESPRRPRKRSYPKAALHGGFQN
jgi:hypothetical protein